MPTYSLKHLKIGDEAVRLDKDLPDGLYTAVVTRGAILYAQMKTPPTDPLDWLSIPGGFTSYRVEKHSPRLPVWVRAVPGLPEPAIVVRQRRQ